ncbi:hypothetical protein [Gordonia hongkongensis]|uniref:hypothetical protein n=1 Tax=Gordonia hongkongensis TaxID=1701090 RepID=UPI003EBB5E9A
MSITPSPGEHWVYRKNDRAASQEVEVLAITTDGRKQRCEIRFVEDSRTETVPVARLRTAWENVEAFDMRMSNWERLGDFDLHDVEQYALDDVFETLVPESVATLEYRPVRCAVTVHDEASFADLIGVPFDEVARQCFSCKIDGELTLSPEGALIAAELMCRRDPQTVLDLVIAEEADAREKCRHGRYWGGSKIHGRDRSDPQFEWQVYLESTRPRLELLRQWCGFRAVTADERRRAAEDEARRLDLLLVRAIEALPETQSALADSLRREHELERITPARSRPQVDRPLRPDEMPVREIRVRQRRWW